MIQIHLLCLASLALILSCPTAAHAIPHALQPLLDEGLATLVDEADGSRVKA